MNSVRYRTLASVFKLIKLWSNCLYIATLSIIAQDRLCVPQIVGEYNPLSDKTIDPDQSYAIPQQANNSPFLSVIVPDFAGSLTTTLDDRYPAFRIERTAGKLVKSQSVLASFHVQ